MTIEKQPPGLWFAFCDGTCGTKVELDTDPDDSFVEAVAEIKEKGWAILREHIGGTWAHICPDCREYGRQKVAKVLGFDA